MKLLIVFASLVSTHPLLPFYRHGEFISRLLSDRLLGERVQAGLEITRKALQFALHYGVLEINERACIRCMHSANAENQLSKIKFARIASNARRLGAWFGDAPSDAAIYNLLGLEV